MNKGQEVRERATEKHRGTGPPNGPTTGPQRWVTVVMIVIGVLLLLGFFYLHLSGGLGPGLHGGG